MFWGIVVVSFMVAVFLMLYKAMKDKELEKELKEKDNAEIFMHVEYLGGHPTRSEGAAGELNSLSINKDRIIYRFQFTRKSSEKIFDIKIEDITDCSIETKESLSAKRIALVGMLAFGLKKDKKYIRIAFDHELGEQEILFHHRKGKNHEIVNKINNIRMQKLKGNK